ncbi:hypothetical protein [Pedobacter insulae]|uniref:Lipoprotein n=1 Tax=Pedobacter insulae TaxID=414048 RepID=A0A1I2TST3_9SPHI|nr:hypothetical protein [Pedobacter insulae]SFG65526.1 hypothetical protein SAMN04489864_101468 [Pedobacter insulae]
MKRTILPICLLGCLALGACNLNPGNRHSISITTQDNGSDLNFKANFPENKTTIAQDYIESNLKETRIFSSLNDVKKVAIRLNDGTQFYIRYEPGFIAINFDRDKNSFSSYNRMKKMISGFGNAIKD